MASSKSDKAPEPSAAASQRRRREQRYRLEAPLQVKCSSWESFAELFSLNIAKTGLFIPTDEVADVGEMAAIVMYAPDKSPFRINAVVRHVLAAKGQRPAGLGIEVVDIAPSDLPHYEQLVKTAATQNQPLFDIEEAVEIIEDDVDDDTPTPLSPSPVEPRPSAAAAPKPLVAIDFGTSRSSVAVVKGSHVQVVRAPEGGWDIPSIVAFIGDGSVSVGSPARQILARDPTHAIRSPKRLLGRCQGDPEIEPYLAALATPHAWNHEREIVLYFGDQAYTVSQLCAPIIYQMKVLAEAHLEQPVEEAVFTVPTSFDDDRFRALTAAAQLAGLKVAEFIDEPSAAAYAHRFDTSFDGLIAVYDFGGGTFDFSLAEVTDGDLRIITTAGDTWLGGDDFDEALANAAANAFWREHKIELRNDVVRWQQLMLAAEKTKRDLSSRDKAVLELPEAALRKSGPIDLRIQVTRDAFAALSTPIVERSLQTCAEAMELAGITPADITSVYLSGGTTYLPVVREALTRYFGKPPQTSVPPERSVVMGAAVYAALARGANITI